MNTALSLPSLAARFPFLACLAGAALALARPDILIFHGGGPFIGNCVSACVSAWARWAQGHAEAITWLLGLPALGALTTSTPEAYEQPSQPRPEPKITKSRRG